MVWCGIIVCYDMEEWRSMVWSCEGIVWCGIEESMGQTEMSAVSGTGWKFFFYRPSLAISSLSDFKLVLRAARHMTELLSNSDEWQICICF